MNNLAHASLQLLQALDYSKADGGTMVYLRVGPAFLFLLWHQNLNIVINEQCQGFLLHKHTDH